MTLSAQPDSSPAPAGHASQKYRPDIDGLRAVAVVAYHAFPETIKSRFIGVDIFFVISGFLISTIVFESLTARRLSVSDFYRRCASIADSRRLWNLQVPK